MRFDGTFLKNNGFKSGWKKMLLKIDQIDLSPLKKNQSSEERKKNSVIPLPASHNHF